MNIVRENMKLTTVHDMSKIPEHNYTDIDKATDMRSSNISLTSLMLISNFFISAYHSLSVSLTSIKKFFIIKLSLNKQA